MIQIDIKMPKCCDECFALDDHGDYPFCLISQDQRGYTFNTKEKRMPTCPLKAQEPRVMTLEEARRDIEIWYESINGASGYGDLCYDANAELAIYTPHGIKGVKEDAYGKTWRCWTSRPTDEQRKATKWDG